MAIDIEALNASGETNNFIDPQTTGVQALLLLGNFSPDNTAAFKSRLEEIADNPNTVDTSKIAGASNYVRAEFWKNEQFQGWSFNEKIDLWSKQVDKFLQRQNPDNQQFLQKIGIDAQNGSGMIYGTYFKGGQSNVKQFIADITEKVDLEDIQAHQTLITKLCGIFGHHTSNVAIWLTIAGIENASVTKTSDEQVEHFITKARRALDQGNLPGSDLLQKIDLYSQKWSEDHPNKPVPESEEAQIAPSTILPAPSGYQPDIDEAEKVEIDTLVIRDLAERSLRFLSQHTNEDFMLTSEEQTQLHNLIFLSESNLNKLKGNDPVFAQFCQWLEKHGGVGQIEIFDLNRSVVAREIEEHPNGRDVTVPSYIWSLFDVMKSVNNLKGSLSRSANGPITNPSGFAVDILDALGYYEEHDKPDSYYKPQPATLESAQSASGVFIPSGLPQPDLIPANENKDTKPIDDILNEIREQLAQELSNPADRRYTESRFKTDASTLLEGQQIPDLEQILDQIGAEYVNLSNAGRAELAVVLNQILENFHSDPILFDIGHTLATMYSRTLGVKKAFSPQPERPPAPEPSSSPWARQRPAESQPIIEHHIVDTETYHVQNPQNLKDQINNFLEGSTRSTINFVVTPEVLSEFAKSFNPDLKSMSIKIESNPDGTSLVIINAKGDKGFVGGVEIKDLVIKDDHGHFTPTNKDQAIKYIRGGNLMRGKIDAAFEDLNQTIKDGLKEHLLPGYEPEGLIIENGKLALRVKKSHRLQAD